MKKLLLIIFCLFGLFGYSQDEYYRIVDWKFYPENVIQLTDSTYTTDAIPFDYNDQGAIQRIVGGYVVDFVGHRYEVIDSTSTTITVLDIYHTMQAPQTGQIARCYRSVYNGDSKYVGSVDYSPLDESARWKMNGSDNEILWRHGIDYEFPFKRLVLDTNYVHDGSEIKGTVAWEETTQSVETHIADDLHLNNGEELWVPLCINNSGVDIINGQPVYINGASGSSPTIQLASNITYDESRLIGVATQDIPNGTSGRVTRFGFVNEINLSGCTAGGNVYLGDKVLTHVRPMGGLFPVVIGKSIVCTVSGRLLVYPQSVEYTSETNNAYGWASYLQGEQTNISFVDATRVFTVSPVASTFYFYQAGLKYIKTGAQTTTISDVEGLHIIYYDLGVLLEMVNPSSSQIVDAIRNKVITSVIYWDAINKISIYVSNERHTFHWPSWVHAYAHLSFGTQYGNGLALTNITLGIGSVNADAQFGSDSGAIVDEDIVTSIPTVLSTAGIPIYYRLGSGLGNWRRVTRSGYAFLNDGTTGLAMYNLNSGGAWSIVSMTNNYYRLVHVFATNDIGDPNKIIAMSGVAQYSSASDAEAAVNNEILNIYNSNLPFAEVKHIGSLILHTKTGLGNTVNARYIAIPSKPSGANYYMDYRRSTVIGTGGGGSGASTILGLSDTPDSYASHANKIFGVNSGETGMEFKAITATVAGTVNIPSGQQYQINGGSVVVDAINDAVTTTTSSQNAIFDALALKENLSNKENSTVDTSTTKYPTVNLLKTYADTKDPSTTNELNSSLTFNTSTNDLTVVDAGGNKTANISVNADLLINGYSGSISATANPISFSWPVAYSDTNYYLDIFAHYTETIDGKSVLIRNAVYDFIKTTTGFSLKLDTLAGVVEYRASRTINSETPANVVLKSDSTILFVTPTQLNDSSVNWNTAYIDRLKWNGGSTGLVAATGRTSLGGTAIGQSMFTLTNPSAITFPRFNADNTITALSADDFKTAIGATGGTSTATGEIWTAKTGTYASATTFTFTGTDKDVGLLEMSLFTCTDAAGTTRRIGYIKTATNASGTITANVITNTDLASGDKDFKIAYNRKATDYMKLVTIPGECIADASFSQGMFYADIQTNSYLLPVDFSVLTAASGSGAALIVNIYKNTTALFSSAPDLATNTVLRSQRPTTNTITAAEVVSLRIMSSAGATNKAADFQAKLYIVPQTIFTAF